jgi:hypothetical protein
VEAPPAGRRRKHLGIRSTRAKRFLQRVLSIRILIVVSVVVLVVAAGLVSYLTQHFVVKSGIDDLSNSIKDLVSIGVEYQVDAGLQSGTMWRSWIMV